MQIFDYLNKEGLLHLIRKIMGRDVDLTQAEYDALPESKNSDGKNYYIYDSDIAVTAEEVGFDGSTSGSTAANSQQALDELFAADKKTNESLENLNSNLSNKANSKIALEYDGTTENKDFNVLDLFGDIRGIYLISSACDYYKASYGVWLVGLSKSSDQNFITRLSGINASLTINLDRTLTFNANYPSIQHYVVNVIKLA